LEEAAFISPNLFFQVVVPLLGVARTAVLAISTPQKGKNYYQTLMELKDETGAQLFHCIGIGLTCKKCKLLKKACTHMLYLQPAWKPAHLLRKQDAILEGQDELREMETRGGIPAGTGELLPNDVIADMRSRPRFEIPSCKPHIIYVGIDPNCGGSSDFAIVSLAEIHGTPVVSKHFEQTTEYVFEMHFVPK